MDQCVYRNMLENVMEPYTDEFLPVIWSLLYDNDPRHATTTVKQWREEKQIRELEWHAQSPGLNPIENLWGDVEEDHNRGKPNWEHLSDELHVLLTVEDTENRAQIKLERAVEEVKKLLVPQADGEDELKKRQLMELAIINGTYRDSSSKAASVVGNDLKHSEKAEARLKMNFAMESLERGEVTKLSMESKILIKIRPNRRHFGTLETIERGRNRPVEGGSSIYLVLWRLDKLSPELYGLLRLRRRMEKGCGRRGGGCVAPPESRHPRSRHAPAYAHRASGRAADPVAAHVRSDDGGVDPQRFGAARFAAVHRRPPRPSVHAVRCRVHELRRPRRDAPSDGICDGGSFRCSDGCETAQELGSNKGTPLPKGWCSVLKTIRLGVLTQSHLYATPLTKDTGSIHLR
ncbi:putative RNA binding protein [Trypoxylus dichotomus]